MSIIIFAISKIFSIKITFLVDFKYGPEKIPLTKSPESRPTYFLAVREHD